MFVQNKSEFKWTIYSSQTVRLNESKTASTGLNQIYWFLKIQQTKYKQTCSFMSRNLDFESCFSWTTRASVTVCQWLSSGIHFSGPLSISALVSDFRKQTCIQTSPWFKKESVVTSIKMTKCILIVANILCKCPCTVNYTCIYRFNSRTLII